MIARHFFLTPRPGLWYDVGMQVKTHNLTNQAFTAPEVKLHIVWLYLQLGGHFFFKGICIMAYYRLRAQFFVDQDGVVTIKENQYLSYEAKKFIYERDNYTCQICGKKVRVGGLYDTPFNVDETVCGSIDHILPISRGGQHTDFNMRVLCRSCNCSRKAAI